MLYEVEVDCRIVLNMSVESLHELDREESPWGIYKYPIVADSKEEAKEYALDRYHSTIPIKVLDDFDIYTEAYELKYVVKIHDYGAMLKAQELADETGDSCKFKVTMARAMNPFGIYDLIDVYADTDDNHCFTIVHTSSVLVAACAKKARELRYQVTMGEITQQEALTLEREEMHKARGYVRGVVRHGAGKQEWNIDLSPQEGIYYAIHT